MNCEPLPHIWLCTRSHLNFLIYEKNFVFFFISVPRLSLAGRRSGAVITGLRPLWLPVNCPVASCVHVLLIFSNCSPPKTSSKCSIGSFLPVWEQFYKRRGGTHCVLAVFLILSQYITTIRHRTSYPFCDHWLCWWHIHRYRAKRTFFN